MRLGKRTVELVAGNSEAGGAVEPPPHQTHVTGGINPATDHLALKGQDSTAQAEGLGHGVQPTALKA